MLSGCKIVGRSHSRPWLDPHQADRLQKTADIITNATCMEDNMTSMLDIANASNRKQRFKACRNTHISAFLIIFLICVLNFGISFFKIYSGGAVYIGSQTIDAQNYIYMDIDGNLYRFISEDPQMYHAIISGRRDKSYIIT